VSEQKGISRRQFIIGAVGAGAALVGGAAFMAAQQPAIEFSEFQCDQAASSPGKVLVAYTSQYGATAGVAAAIAQTLCQSGVAADAKLVANVNDLSAYRAVIVGSPVISEAWMPEAVSFVESNRSLLRGLPVAYFLTCMTLALMDEPAERQKIAGVLTAVEQQIPEVKPVEKGLFAGALDYNKMSYFMRVMYRVFSEDDTAGDFRNWEAIRAWSETLKPRLVENS